MQEFHLKNRPNRWITRDNEIYEILQKGQFLVISTCRNDEPYKVSLIYGFDEKNKSIFVHCAKSGLKIDFFKSNSRIDATIIEDGGNVKE